MSSAAHWGTPIRRNVTPLRADPPTDPHGDLARLIERRADRALPGVPDTALDDFVGDADAPLPALEEPR